MKPSRNVESSLKASVSCMTSSSGMSCLSSASCVAFMVILLSSFPQPSIAKDYHTNSRQATSEPATQLLIRAAARAMCDGLHTCLRPPSNQIVECPREHRYQGFLIGVLVCSPHQHP